MRAMAGMLRITLLCPVALGFCLTGAFGQTVQGDVAPRRVVVPGKQSGPRITVQIDPTEQARRLIVAPQQKPAASGAPQDVPLAETPVVLSASDYAWYWDLVPASQDARADRYTLAIASLTNGPDGATVQGPRLQYLQDLAAEHGIEILKATVGTKVSPALVLAVMGVAASKAPAVSAADAKIGLMKLEPEVAERFGVKDAGDPVQSIIGAVAYLNWLMVQFDQDPLMVLAAYNAGKTAVEANEGVPPYPQVRAWVPNALAAWQVAQGLCVTSPELMSDPCVFRVLAVGYKN